MLVVEVAELSIVVSLPMRDGNLLPTPSRVNFSRVVSLPMRDGNPGRNLQARQPVVVSLPMRDGNKDKHYFCQLQLQLLAYL